MTGIDTEYRVLHSRQGNLAPDIGRPMDIPSPIFFLFLLPAQTRTPRLRRRVRRKYRRTNEGTKAE